MSTALTSDTACLRNKESNLINSDSDDVEITIDPQSRSSTPIKAQGLEIEDPGTYKSKGLFYEATKGLHEFYENKDSSNILLLIALYWLQGVPLGLAHGSIPFLLKEKLSYAQVGLFSLAGYPYSLKLFGPRLLTLHIIEDLAVGSHGLFPSSSLPPFCSGGLEHTLTR